jgi:hypothetical protein
MLNTISLRHIGILMIVLKSALIIFFVLQIIFFSTEGNPLSFNNDIFIFIAAGFAAQLIDGALGMAYGVSCNSLLLGFGIPPALASASIHTAEVFTTGVSGLSHLLLRNVNRRLLLKIAIPGVIGSAAGAFLISNVFDGGIIKPVISGYLLLMGVLILRKSLSKTEIVPQTRTGKVSFLGLAGGFFDAIGGGGWGPIVTTNLIHRGNTPKQTIGTVNTAEFKEIESISLKTTKETIEKGEEKTIYAVYNPSDVKDKTLYWISSNTSVVTVEKGRVKAVGKGTATITAVSRDGGKTASCEITVK